MPAGYLQAYLLPRLNIQGIINFLIDTGADNTTLSLIDVERLNIRYTHLLRKSLTNVSGIAGVQRFYSENGVLLFRSEEDSLNYFETNIHLPKRGNRTQCQLQRELPSIMGRDIINQCKMTVDFHQGIIELEPPEVTRLPQTTPRRLI